MQLSKLLGKNAALVAVLAAGAAITACSEDPATGGGGSGSGGKGSGGAAGGAGVTNTGGAPTGGSAGAATGGVAGTATGGVAGTATGGVAGAAGTAGGGGDAGTGGAPAILFDFETDIQGWQADPEVPLAVDPAQFVTGLQSLKVTIPALAPDTSELVLVNGVELWPDTVVTIHVWTPAGTDGLYVQGFTQVNNYKVFTPGAGVTLNRGAWTTMTVTVPPGATTFPGGIQQLGVQFGVPASGAAFAGGDFYVDSITAAGGTAVCAVGTDTGAHTFEANIAGWAVDGGHADTVLSWSAEQFNTGANSMKVAMTAVPAMGASPTERNIILDVGDVGNKAYCGDTISASVRLPAGATDIRFQVYGQYNGYTLFTGMFPATYTLDGWTTQTYLLPAIGARGLQRIGIQFQNVGVAAFTGDIYIDDVTW